MRPAFHASLEAAGHPGLVGTGPPPDNSQRYSEVITGGIGFDTTNGYSIYDSNPLGTASDRWQVKLDKALIGDGYFFVHAICATASS